MDYKTNEPDWLSDDFNSILLAELSEPSGDRTRIAILSDPHIAQGGESGWKMPRFTAERFNTALSIVHDIGVDGLVVAGDLTRSGDKAEFEQAADVLSRSRTPYVCVPGNHDVADVSQPLCEFAEFFRAGMNVQFPLVHSCGSVTIVGLNSISVNEAGVVFGEVTDAQLERLDAVLPDLTNPVVVLHHTIAESWSVENALSPEQFRIRNARTVRDVLRANGVPLVVSGHAHWPLCGRSGQTQQIVSPAICSYPQSFLLIEVRATGTEISLVPLTNRELQRRAYRCLCRDRPLNGSYARIARSDYLERFPLLEP